VQFYRNLALLDKLADFLHVLVFHVLGVRGVVALEEHGEQLQSCFFHRQLGVLESVVTDFTKSTGDDGAKSLLHESPGVFLLCHKVEVHGVNLGRHLDGQLDACVPLRVLEELVSGLFTRHDKAVVLELHDEQLVSLLNLLLLLEQDRAVAKNGLLLCDELSRLVRSETKRAVPLVGEDDLFCEIRRVFNKQVTFFESSEVVEDVLVKDTVLGAVDARDELLVHLPGDGAEVAVLRQTLLQVATVDV